MFLTATLKVQVPGVFSVALTGYRFLKVVSIEELPSVVAVPLGAINSALKRLSAETLPCKLTVIGITQFRTLIGSSKMYVPAEKLVVPVELVEPGRTPETHCAGVLEVQLVVCQA
jgi:hypothetical protein